jgi:TrmH family RNA methyltransferase
MTTINHDKGSGLKPLKWYSALADKKARLESGAFIIEGERAICQVMLSDAQAILELLSTDELAPVYSQYPQRLLTAGQLRSISSVTTPQGIVAVVSFPPDIYSDQLPPVSSGRILLLEDVQDPGNAGTLIRTAAAFGYAGVILSDKCADPLSPKCVQSSAGSTLALWLRKSEAYIRMAYELKKRGFTLLAADLEGKDILPPPWPQKMVLALGNEGAGLSETLLDAAEYKFRLAVAEEKAESLNVASCGAICMYLSCQPPAETNMTALIR